MPSRRPDNRPMQVQSRNSTKNPSRSKKSVPKSPRTPNGNRWSPGSKRAWAGKQYPFFNSKHQGGWAELILMARVTGLGCTVSVPHGDNARYDNIVQHRWKLSRVQVKSVGVLRDCCYKVKIESVFKPRYEARDVDFIAVYVIPVDAWYVIPIAALKGVQTILLRPNRPTRA